MEFFHPDLTPFTIAIIIMLLILVMEVAGVLFGAALSVGRVPVLMLVVVFLTGFGLSGWIAQNIIHGVLGFYLPAFLMIIPAFVVALLATRHGGLLLARIMPKEETDAVSADTFVGQVAVILRGEAKPGLPAEAKLKDIKGKAQYVLVEPDLADAVFKAGDKVLLVERDGATFKAIASTNVALSQA